MAHPQPSPPGAVPAHHGHLAAHPQVNGHLPLQSQGQKAPQLTVAQRIAQLNEQVWIGIGMLAHLFRSCPIPITADVLTFAYRKCYRGNG